METADGDSRRICGSLSPVDRQRPGQDIFESVDIRNYCSGWPTEREKEYDLLVSKLVPKTGGTVLPMTFSIRKDSRMEESRPPHRAPGEAGRLDWPPSGLLFRRDQTVTFAADAALTLQGIHAAPRAAGCPSVMFAQ
jgi:hypothetical protein